MNDEKIIAYLKKAVSSNYKYQDVIDKIKSKFDKNASVDNYTIGNIDGIVISSGGLKYFYAENIKNRSSLTKYQSKLNVRGCPPPFYLVGEGEFKRQYNNIQNDDDFKDLIFSIFNFETMAMIYNQIICNSSLLSVHKSTIFESMEAYWLGMDYISTDSLMSVMEGTLRELIEKAGQDRPALKFQKYIRELAINRVSVHFETLKKFHWYPYKCSNFDNALAERGSDEELKFWVLIEHSMDALNAFLSWFSNVLYKKFDDSETEFYLNRHNYFHAFSPRIAVPVHYPLMLWALLSLVYMESLFIAPIDPFCPEIDENDKKLGLYFKDLMKGVGKLRRNAARTHGVTY